MSSPWRLVLASACILKMPLISRRLSSKQMPLYIKWNLKEEIIINSIRPSLNEIFQRILVSIHAELIKKSEQELLISRDTWFPMARFHVILFFTASQDEITMKKIFTLSISLLSFSLFAGAPVLSNCTPSLPTEHPDFCASFKSSASCHCMESGLPRGTCQNMDTVYRLMMARFGSLQRACEYQHNTSTQECIDDWTCYRQGGKNSQGGFCSTTGNAC